MQKIKKDDLVKIIAGKDKDKQGKVLEVNTKKGTVLVEGCNMVTNTRSSVPTGRYPSQRSSDPYLQRNAGC